MDGRSALLSLPPSLLPAESNDLPAYPASMPREHRWRLSLVLPAYNEQAGIRQAVLEACAALAQLTRDYEILVVDDGSKDDTAAIVAALAAERKQVRLLRHERNRGYGAALRTGFAAARFERVAFTDADCQFHLADLGRLLPLSDRYPVVVGCRRQRQDSLRRCLLSRGYNILTSALLGTRVRDCDCALKVFRREVLPELMPETNTFFVNAEMLTKARQRGLEVAEVDVRHRPRLHGESKVSLSEVPRILATLLPFWWSRVLFAGEMPSTSPQRQRRAEDTRRWRSVLVIFLLVMGSFSVFGVHDWAARLVPGLAGVLTILLTYWWGCRVVGERVGMCGALVLCLSAGFIYRQRMLNMDSLLCLWVTAALASGHTALTAGRILRQRWWLLSALACGLGLLTKGPVALILIALPLLLYSFLEPRAGRFVSAGWVRSRTELRLRLARWWRYNQRGSELPAGEDHAFTFSGNESLPGARRRVGGFPPKSPSPAARHADGTDTPRLPGARGRIPCNS